LAINKQQLIKTMPQFSYKAKEGPGKIVDGVIEASNNEGAINEIIRSGLVPLEVVPAELNTGSKTEKSVKKESLRLIRQVSLKDLTVFTRQISDLVDASVPMLRSLQITSSQTRSPHFKQVIDEMHASVKDGSAFSDALARHKQVFSSLFINMVKAGEVSGNLEKVLRRLADYLEKEQETRSKVKSSLAYPMLILVVGIVTVFVLLTFVIPRLSVIFDDLDQALPLPTVILTGISGFFAQPVAAVFTASPISSKEFNAIAYACSRFVIFIPPLISIHPCTKPHSVQNFSLSDATHILPWPKIFFLPPVLSRKPVL